MTEPEESSNLTSSQMKQRIREQTKGMREVPEDSDIQMPTEPLETAEEEETTEEQESKPAETTEEETEETQVTEEKTEKEAEQPTEEKQEPLYKIKVEGKEEELPLEKLREYAQKGRHYEKEMAKLKKEREQLRTTATQIEIPKTQTQTTILTPEKANEEFLNEFAKNPLGALAQVQQFMFQQRDQHSAEEKKADREFDMDQKESNPIWNDIKPRFNEYRELGYTREMAAMAAENDFLKTAIVNAQTAGRKDGEKKAKAKAKAEIPMGGKGTKSKESGISDEALAKMNSKTLRSKLPRINTPGY